MNLTSQGKRKLTTRQKQLVVHLGRHKVLKKDINSLGSTYSSSFLAIDYFVLPYINKTYILSRDDILIHVYSCVKINLLYKKPKICYLCFILIIIACHSARRFQGDNFLPFQSGVPCHRYNLFIFKVRTPLKRTSGPFFLQVLSINYKIGC